MGKSNRTPGAGGQYIQAQSLPDRIEQPAALSPAEAAAQWQAFGLQQQARAEALELELANLKLVQAALELRLKEAELPKRLYCFSLPGQAPVSFRVRASSEAAARAQLPASEREQLQFRGCQG